MQGKAGYDPLVQPPPVVHPATRSPSKSLQRRLAFFEYWNEFTKF